MIWFIVFFNYPLIPKPGTSGLHKLVVLFFVRKDAKTQRILSKK
jgi:hypothetical protein